MSNHEAPSFIKQVAEATAGLGIVAISTYGVRHTTIADTAFEYSLLGEITGAGIVLDSIERSSRGGGKTARSRHPHLPPMVFDLPLSGSEA